MKVTVETTELSAEFRSEIAAKTDNNEVLAELAKDEAPAVRAAVAGNAKTSARILSELAKDEDFDVREVVKNNPKFKQ